MRRFLVQKHGRQLFIPQLLIIFHLLVTGHKELLIFLFVHISAFNRILGHASRQQQRKKSVLAPGSVHIEHTGVRVEFYRHLSAGALLRIDVRLYNTVTLNTRVYARTQTEHVLHRNKRTVTDKCATISHSGDIHKRKGAPLQLFAGFIVYQYKVASQPVGY